MKKRNLFLKVIAIALLLGNGALLDAQVTMGSLKVPENFSVLELISNQSNGMRLPQILTTADRDVISKAHGSNPEMMGLQIFNMETKCVETWNGEAWIENCAPALPAPVTPQAVTLNFSGNIGDANIKPSAISDITVKSDTENIVILSGRGCFDIVYVNEGDSCGQLTFRASSRADFSTSYTYLLSGSVGGTITGVTWNYTVNDHGLSIPNAVNSFTPSAMSTTLGNNYVDVTFNPALLTTALGETGITVTISALVTISDSTYLLERKVNIRDCVCCPCRFDSQQ